MTELHYSFLNQKFWILASVRFVILTMLWGWEECNYRERRLSNKQRGGIFASNNNIFSNASNMRMFMLFVLCILKCWRHDNVYVVCSIYSQMPGARECLCCLFCVFSNAWGMRMFLLFVMCIIKCSQHENVYVVCFVYSQMSTAWECL